MNAEQLYSVPETNPRAFSFRIGVWWFLIVTVFKDWCGISFRLGNWLESHNLNILKAPYRSEMLNRSQKRWIDAVSKTFHWHLVEIGQFQYRARHRLLLGCAEPQLALYQIEQQIRTEFGRVPAGPNLVLTLCLPEEIGMSSLQLTPESMYLG